MTARRLCLTVRLVASVLLASTAACTHPAGDSADSGDTGTGECVSELRGEDCPTKLLYQYTCDNCEQSLYCAHRSSASDKTVWLGSDWPCECIGDDGHIIKSDDCQMTW